MKKLSQKEDKRKNQKRGIPRVLSLGSLEQYSDEDLRSLQYIIDSEGLSGLIGEKQANLVQNLEEALFKSFQEHQKDFHAKPFKLGDTLSYITKCNQKIIKDDFTQCFRNNEILSWNMNVTYYIFWCFGVLFRYCILFPIRLLILVVVSLLILVILLICKLLRVKGKYLRRLIQHYCGVWLLCLGGVMVVHGKPPKRKKNQIYVSNHTSVLDIAYLNRLQIFSCIGQLGSPLILFFQKYILFPMQSIWFQRFEKNDRSLVKAKIMNHIENVQNPPLLVFPEGVCVNNQYTVMFHKGIFEFENIEVVPIAMKFDLNWSDPFFRNNENFFQHVVRLMTSWATRVDIHYLPAMKKRKGESAIDFSCAVKEKISRSIGLKSCSWDGYMKYFSASEKWKKNQQEMFSKKLLKKLEYWKKRNLKRNEPEEIQENFFSQTI